MTPGVEDAAANDFIDLMPGNWPPSPGLASDLDFNLFTIVQVFGSNNALTQSA